MTEEFINIKGNKNDTFVFNTFLPQFGINSCRFPIIQDYMSFQGDFGEITPIDPFPNACEGIDLKLPDQYKVNQIVGLRFIEPEAAGNFDLIKEQKFNKYIMSGIITNINIPETTETKGQITIKLLQDYGLNKDSYFNARVVIMTNQSNNFIQNKSYSIQRYYKKDLGIGPRLGGSFIQTLSNKTTGTYNDATERDNTYLFTSVLKDEERLNKPYKNIKFKGDISNHVDFYGTQQEVKSINHEFTELDFGGQFTKLGDWGYFYNSPLSKKFIPEFRTYLIKNLDEHSYDYYQELKAATGIGKLLDNLYNYNSFFYVFCESYENPKIKFGSYDE
jgi:hypothetical protein